MMKHKTPILTCLLFNIIKFCHLMVLLLPAAALTNEPQTANDANTSATQAPPIDLLSPEQIEQKLYMVAQDKGLDGDFDGAPISYIGNQDSPVGLDVNAITRLPTLQSVSNEYASTTTGLDPQAYIPTYQHQGAHNATKTDIDKPKQVGLIKRLYNRLFNDGVDSVVRVKAHIYYDAQNQDKITDTSQLTKLGRKDNKQEPFANIKAALEDMSAQSVADFRGSVARIRQTVNAAARAVGYYDMDFSITKAGVGEVNVIIHRLGEPVRVDNWVLDVRGDGLYNPAYLQVVQDANPKKGDIFHHGAYEATKSALNDVSGEEGYFDSKWLDSSVDVILPDNIADVSLIYDTGQQYVFDEVVFFTIDPQTNSLTTDPDKLPVKPELLKKLLTFDMGDAYNRSATRELSNSLLATGYFNAVNTQTVLPSKDVEAGIGFEQSAGSPEEPTGQDIALEDGTNAYVAPLEFSTSQAISDKLALVAQKAEQLYNAPDDRLLITDSAQQSKNILGRISDAVSNIAKLILPDESGDVLPKLDDGNKTEDLQGRKTPQQVYQDKKVPLYIFVMSDKPRDAELGMGWGSDSGTRFIGKFTHNLLDKKGTQAGLDVRLSQHQKGVNTYVTRPISHPLNDKAKANLSYKEESINQGAGNFDLSTKTLETGISRHLIKDNGVSHTYSLRYRLDELQTHAPREVWQDLPVQFLSGNPTQEALLAGYAMNKTVADNLVNPMRGYRQYLALEAGVKGVLTDTNMAIAKAGISGVYSFGNNSYGKDRAHQLIGALQGGYIWANNFDAVPYKLRFFAGGDQSIRGYSYQSLSPLSDKGYLTGGQTLAVASAEYNYEVLKDVRLGVFADVGNAYDKRFSNQTKIGAGVGLRWASPVGQVRIDVATGVQEKNHPIKLHFFIGTPF